MSDASPRSFLPWVAPSRPRQRPCSSRSSRSPPLPRFFLFSFVLGSLTRRPRRPSLVSRCYGSTSLLFFWCFFWFFLSSAYAARPPPSPPVARSLVGRRLPPRVRRLLDSRSIFYVPNVLLPSLCSRPVPVCPSPSDVADSPVLLGTSDSISMSTLPSFWPTFIVSLRFFLGLTFPLPFVWAGFACRLSASTLPATVALPLFLRLAAHSTPNSTAFEPSPFVWSLPYFASSVYSSSPAPSPLGASLSTELSFPRPTLSVGYSPFFLDEH